MKPQDSTTENTEKKSFKNEVVLELKAVESMHKIFEAQILTYLKATDKRVGLLINFNVERLKDGIKRLIL